MTDPRLTDEEVARLANAFPWKNNSKALRALVREVQERRAAESLPGTPNVPCMGTRLRVVGQTYIATQLLPLPGAGPEIFVLCLLRDTEKAA